MAVVCHWLLPAVPGVAVVCPWQAVPRVAAAVCRWLWPAVPGVVEGSLSRAVPRGEAVVFHHREVAVGSRQVRMDAGGVACHRLSARSLQRCP